MADQNLNIKVRIGTQGGESVLKFANEIENATKRQTKLVTEQEKLEKQLTLAVKEQATLFKQLEITRKTFNEQVKGGLVNQQEAFYLLQAEANRYNQQLAKTKDTVTQISKQLTEIGRAKNLGLGVLEGKTTAPVSASASGIGASLGIAVPKLQEDLKKTADIFATQLGIAIKNASSQLPVNQAAAIKQGFSFTSGATNLVKEQQQVIKLQENLANGSDNVTKAVTGQLTAWNRLKNGLAGIIVEYRAINAIYNSILNFIRDIPNVGLQQQAVEANVTAIFGTEQAAKNLQFLAEIADKAGQSIDVLQNAYSKFAPSATLAGATQEEVNKTFKDFSEVSTVMKLTTDKVNSLYLALEQMYAKGTVQSEEIKKQLGNVLPGAVEIGAKAMDKTPAAFMEAMKKNEVIAKEFIPKFAAYYRQIFGGPDDSVFISMTDKLQSNLNRLDNSLRSLKLALFSEVEVALNSLVKTSASAVDSLTANLNGIKQALEILAALIGIRLIASFGSLVEVIRRSAVALSGLSFPITSAITLTTAYIGSLSGLSLGYEEATGFTVSFKEETVTLTSYLETVAINTYESLANAVTKITEAFLGLKGVNPAAILESLIPNRNDIADFLGYVNVIKNAIPSASGMKLVTPLSDEEAFTKGREGFLNAQEGLIKQAAERDAENYAKTFAGKSAVEVQKAIASGKLKTTAQITKALEKTVDIPAPKGLFDDKKVEAENTARAGRSAKRISDAYQAAMNGIKANLEELRGDVQDKLAVINDQFKNNAISISDFFAQRKELLAEDIRLQKESLNEQIKVAFAQKDASKVADLNRQLKKLANSESKESIKILNEEAEAYEKYRESLTSLNIEFMRMQGQGKEAAILEFRERYKSQIQQAIVNQDFGTFDKIKTMEGVKAAQEEVGVIQERLTKETEKYNQTIERTNILKNIGAVSELGAAKQITEANKRYIAEREKAIALEERAIEVAKNAGKPYQDMVDKVRIAKEELENFKLTADVVAQTFENMVGGAFTNAFEGFATGTMNARQAWQSFLADIIKGIAKLAAEEARSALIGGLFKMGLSSIGSLFGGGFQGNGPLMSYQNPFANGGVASGLDSVSGTVLTKPTMFPNAKVIPFASGGVLAGEAGAEAVLPLKRGKGGKLGVAMEGGGGAGGNVININVSVDRSQGEDNSAYAARIAEVIAKRVAKEEIANAARPGNINNRVTKFG